MNIYFIEWPHTYILWLCSKYNLYSKLNVQFIIIYYLVKHGIKK